MSTNNKLPLGRNAQPSAGIVAEKLDGVKLRWLKKALTEVQTRRALR
jgi:hypothetical protein